MFDDTLKYCQNNLLITLLLFVAFVLLNMYITAEITPSASGFGLLIGTLGALIGAGFGNAYQSKRNGLSGAAKAT